jgi:hypothetical protein
MKVDRWKDDAPRAIVISAAGAEEHEAVLHARVVRGHRLVSGTTDDGAVLQTEDAPVRGTGDGVQAAGELHGASVERRALMGATIPDREDGFARTHEQRGSPADLDRDALAIGEVGHGADRGPAIERRRVHRSAS